MERTDTTLLKTVILGVDPGFHVTGYAVSSIENNKVLLCDCGYLKMNPQHSLPHRVGQFYTFMHEKIIAFQVTHLSLETSFLGKNAQTFLKLGFLRGILYLLADQHGLQLTEFAPREIKMATTGFGGASKDQVAGMMLRLFPRLSEFGTIERADVTDALAICLCGVWSHQQQQIYRTH
jgi:crossover junction endodeoxyribonuclease RuvC